MSGEQSWAARFLELSLTLEPPEGGRYAIAYGLLCMAEATELVARRLDELLPSEKIYDLAGLLGKELKEAVMLLPDRE